METSALPNNIADYLEISEELKSRSNELINSSISSCIELINEFVVSNKLQRCGLYSYGSHAISGMIVNHSGEIISDIDLILFMRDLDCEQLSKKSSEELIKKITQSSKVGIEFNFWPETKFKKYMGSGFFGAYRHKYIWGEEIQFPKVKTPTLKMMIYKNLLLLSPPYMNDHSHSYRNSLKFLKRLIEQVCSSHWPVTTNYIELLDQKPFKVIYKEKAMSFFHKESQSDFTYQECIELFEFTKKILVDFSKEIEDLLFLEESRERIDPKILYIYKMYEKILLEKYDQMDQLEFSSYADTQMRKLIEDKNWQGFQSKTKALLLGELNSLLWVYIRHSWFNDHLIFNSDFSKITLYFNKKLPLNFDRNQSYKKIIKESSDICSVRIETDLPIIKSNYFMELFELARERRVSFVINVPNHIAHYFQENAEVQKYEFSRVKAISNQ